MNSILSLSTDILIHILSFSTDADVETFGITSKFSLQISRDDRVWKPRILSLNPPDTYCEPLIRVSMRYIYKAIFYDNRVRSLKQRFLSLDTLIQKNNYLIQSYQQQLTGNSLRDLPIHYIIVMLQGENSIHLESYKEIQCLLLEMYSLYWKSRI
jgi:hypothetical protein